MNDLPLLNGQSGRYALAGDFTSSTSYSGAVIGTFNGTLEGLGHTISNLTINSGSNSVGLIGNLNAGATVRDIALVDYSIGGSNNSNPATLVNRPGITTRSVPTATAMLSAASVDWPAFRPDRSRLSCSLSCEPASASPPANAANSSSRVHPSPIVDASATTTASSATT